MLDADEVQQLLVPVRDVFVDAHLGAAQRMRNVAKDHPAVIAALNATERANFLHGQVRDLVGVGVEPIPGVRVSAWNVDSVLVGSNLVVRFKYLGNGKPANVMTEQQELLAQQQYTQETLDLFNSEGILGVPTTVTCGYTMDGMDIGRVIIQRDCVGYQPWNYDIYGGTTVTVPVTLAGMEPVRPGVVVRSKRKPAEPATPDVTGTDEG